MGGDYAKVPPLSMPDRRLVRPDRNERADRGDRADRTEPRDRPELHDKLLDGLTDTELQQYVKLVIIIHFCLFCLKNACYKPEI